MSLFRVLEYLICYEAFSHLIPTDNFTHISLVAYEEYGRVKPVVSDFDCFLTGTRGVKYQQPIPKEQIDLVKWSVDNIGDVLDEQEPQSKKGWMETWFGVLKKAACKGFYPKTPKYGNGDPKSYEIISVAVSRLNETGCVRHGAECFNYFFRESHIVVDVNNQVASLIFLFLLFLSLQLKILMILSLSYPIHCPENESG